MTHEEWVTRIKYNNERLAQISERTGQMAIAGSANTENPTFVALMTQFDDLIARTDELTRIMLKEAGHS